MLHTSAPECDRTYVPTDMPDDVVFDRLASIDGQCVASFVRYSEVHRTKKLH